MAQSPSSTPRGSAPALNPQLLTVAPRHEVELFGVPRLLAGRARIPVCGATLAEVASDLAQRAPQLAGTVLQVETGWLLSGYSFVVNERFTRDPSQPLTADAAILLVASAAGG